MATFHHRVRRGGRVRITARVRESGLNVARTFDTTDAAKAWAVREIALAAERPDKEKRERLATAAAAVAARRARQQRALPILDALMLFGSEVGPLPGVYFLIDGDEVVYVGQSGNVARRLAEHSADKVFTLIRMLQEHRLHNRLQLERELIEALGWPKYNDPRKIRETR